MQPLSSFELTNKKNVTTKVILFNNILKQIFRVFDDLYLKNLLLFPAPVKFSHFSSDPFPSFQTMTTSPILLVHTSPAHEYEILGLIDRCQRVAPHRMHSSSAALFVQMPAAFAGILALNSPLRGNTAYLQRRRIRTKFLRSIISTVFNPFWSFFF